MKSLRYALSAAVLVTSLHTAAFQKDCISLLDNNPTGNILLQTSALPFGALPYDQIKAEDIKSALEAALQDAKARIEKIAGNKAKPTFKNTIVALQAADEGVARVILVLDNLLITNTNKKLQAISKKIASARTPSDDFLFRNREIYNPVIFARIQKLYEERKSLNLDADELRLLEQTYNDFKKGGVHLPADKQKRLSEISTKLTQLGEEFRSNVGTDDNNFEFVITHKKDLDGLPDSAVAAAADAAKKRKQPGKWIFTTNDAGAFLTYANNRSLREKLWRSLMGTNMSGPTDNRPIALEIAKLRAERAKLLGYNNHAEATLADRMAKTPANVIQFAAKLAPVYRKHAKKDLAQLTKLAGHKIEPWDVSHYSEKLKEQLYGINSEALREFFPLDQVLNGVFTVANKLYGVQVVPRSDLPTWDKEVRTYEVRDRDGKHLALFYFDPFPRESKKSGAWMNNLVDGGLINGKPATPHVVNVLNLRRPINNQPPLLSLYEVTTVFHEFGHALHGMLSKARFRTQFGANVAWDFVELPSQILEKWAVEPEVLALYARHYKTGQPLDMELVETINAANNFMAGTFGLGQVRSFMLDIAWHTEDLSNVKTADDVATFENKIRKKYQLIPNYHALSSVTFNHIFSGSYSSGYYGYQWADVLAADGFAAFKAAGIFDAKTADRFRESILERGNTAPADQMYRNFRQGEPDPDALLKSLGLLD